MQISVIASRGMGIWGIDADGERLGWKSPVLGPVHPQFVPLMEPSGIGWLSGFDELMVRCGLESNGSAVFDDLGRLQYPLHGRVANLPAHSVQVDVDPDAGTISLSGLVDECRFHYQKLRLTTTLTTTFGSRKIAWQDRVTNRSAASAKMQMLYHINVGEPLLGSGSQFIAPIREVSPHDRYGDDLRDCRTYPSIRAPQSQQSFFFEMAADEHDNTKVLLHNAAANRGLSIAYNTRQLPWFTLWRSNVESPDGYVTALEPGTNFPNPRPFEESRQRIVELQPRADWECRVELEWLTERDRVASVRNEIETRQQKVVAVVHQEPQKLWSAKA